MTPLMPGYLVVPTILMTAALALYTAGVWAERVRRYLRPWHVVAFWSGLAADAAGTNQMRLLTRTLEPTLWHSVTGVTAFALMLGHAAWATYVIAKGDERTRATFSRYSLLVWAVWLVPYLGGMVAGIFRGGA